MLADTYNTANKLVGVRKGTSSIVYAYSGLGDRLRQIADGVTTDYTLDINAGLTQVLQDNTNKYVYGNSRIAQIAETQTGYFLPDALGSMRQMTDSSADLTLARTYDPYGNVVSSSGAGDTVYGYTGEQQSGGLVHLRARDYASQLGRFTSRDTWRGNLNQPASYNKWLYTFSNPINLKDPSGLDVGCNVDDPRDPRCHILSLLSQTIFGCKSNDPITQASNSLSYYDPIKTLRQSLDKNLEIKLRDAYYENAFLEESGITLDDFLSGYIAYNYYISHPDEALEANYNDADSYALANLYSEYYLHQIFQPFDEGAVEIFIEQARKNNDAKAYYGGLVWFATNLIWQGAEKGFGGGGGDGSKYKRLSDGEIQMLKDAGFDVHAIKGNVKMGTIDLYKDREGNIYIMLKGAKGYADETGYNIKDLSIK